MPHRTPPLHAVPPMFRGLSEEECVELLARSHVGRIAYLDAGQVGIAPIHYVYDSGWIIGRTAVGAKLTALRHHPWVAFEVDEVRGPFDWRSVVVRGAFYLLDRDGHAGARARWEHAAALLRGLVPGALTAADPAPTRDVLFRIHVGEMTGRLAAP